LRRAFGGGLVELSNELRVDEGLRMDELGRGEAMVDIARWFLTTLRYELCHMSFEGRGRIGARCLAETAVGNSSPRHPRDASSPTFRRGKSQIHQYH
jgi:hypothetical protein